MVCVSNWTWGWKLVIVSRLLLTPAFFTEENKVKFTKCHNNAPPVQGGKTSWKSIVCQLYPYYRKIPCSQRSLVQYTIRVRNCEIFRRQVLDGNYFRPFPAPSDHSLYVGYVHGLAVVILPNFLILFSGRTLTRYFVKSLVGERSSLINITRGNSIPRPSNNGKTTSSQGGGVCLEVDVFIVKCFHSSRRCDAN